MCRHGFRSCSHRLDCGPHCDVAVPAHQGRAAGYYAEPACRLAGFGAYLAAEAVYASGLLVALACGLILGRQQHVEFTARTRFELNAVWGFVEFLVASLVFMLIGLQLRGIATRLADHDWS